MDKRYLSFVQSKQLGSFSFLNNSIKVVWSGDSTTAGDGLSSEYWPKQSLCRRLLQSRHFKRIYVSLNSGYSGKNTEQWRTDYLASDLAQYPDLYILRWGINDPYYLKNGTKICTSRCWRYLHPNRRDIVDFETSLRSGLTTIRASRPHDDQMSIILMSLNSTSDTPNSRDEMV